MTTQTVVVPQYLPDWLVWEELSASEQGSLTRMWEASVDEWLLYLIGILDSDLSPLGFFLKWDGLDRSISPEQVEELRQIPAGRERRECFYRFMDQAPGQRLW